MKIGSLCAGVGGLDLAVEAYFGAETAWVSEIDPGACRVLAHRFPHAPNLGDMTAVDWTRVEPVDILTGGTPCQDLSHAGKRAGMSAGTRSNLWVAMREAIAALRPRLVIWENVRGALSAKADSDMESCPRCVGDPRQHGPVLRALGRVLGDLSSLGYDASWTTLPASDVGAPHGRARVFLVAADATHVGQQRLGRAWVGGSGPADGGRSSVALLPTPTTRDHKGHNQRNDDSCLTGALLPSPRGSDGAHGGPGQRGSRGDLMLSSAVALLPTPVTADAERGSVTYARGNLTLTGALLPTPSAADGLGGHTARGGNRSGEPLLPGAVKLLPTPAVNDMGEGKSVEQWDDWTARMKAEHANGNGHGASLAIEAQRGTWGAYTAAVERWERASRPAPTPTRPDGKNGAHRLNPEFSEWMMGLPAGWVTDLALWEGVKPSAARNAQLRILGNGVVPPQAYEAFRRIERQWAAA